LTENTADFLVSDPYKSMADVNIYYPHAVESAGEWSAS